MVKKGKCMTEAKVFGIVTLSDKGQIAIPVHVRRALNLNSGDQLMIIKRKDNAGFSFISMDMMDKIVDKMREDENFFNKL